MNLKKLNSLYDKEIANKCDKIKKKLEECLDDSFNDEFVCKNYIHDFKKCIDTFDSEFRRKYKIPNYS